MSSFPHAQADKDAHTQRDNRRRTYNLKEQKLAKALISALDIPPNNSTALKLINWKVPTAQDVRTSSQHVREAKADPQLHSPAQASSRVSALTFLTCSR